MCVSPLAERALILSCHPRRCRLRRGKKQDTASPRLPFFSAPPREILPPAQAQGERHALCRICGDFRAIINHYVGMSHYFRLGTDLLAADGGLNGPCAAWHRDFLARAKALGFEVILSLSFELLDQHCPDAWKQRSADGAPALTGTAVGAAVAGQ